MFDSTRSATRFKSWMTMKITTPNNYKCYRWGPGHKACKNKLKKQIKNYTS